MKRLLFKILCAFFLVSSSLPTPVAVAGEDVELAKEAKAAILLDANGTILYKKNTEEELPPASVTKMMPLLLLMEAIDNSEISLKDKVTTSEHAASLGGSQIFLQPGEEMTVQDMLKAIAVASANDASVAIAEFLAGTEEAFVERMNKRAQELGLKHTHFANPHGLTSENHYTSAGDLAIIACELAKHPAITNYTGIYMDQIREQTPEKTFDLVNTNKLVRFYDGVDGFKTGYTQEAGFCLVATAMRDKTRFIAITLGEPDAKTRNKEISHMLDFAFARYKNIPLYQTGELMAKSTIINAEQEQIKIFADNTKTLLTPKKFDEDKITKEIVWNKLEAPLQKGEVVGRIDIRNNDEVVQQLPLRSPKKFKKADWWTLNVRILKNLFKVF
ncbi:MAG: DacF [Bacillota bacterium]|jgi:D-alanyl-D-alanine carboxypeptidase (penicillin-binding protein 5/6)